MTETRRQPKSSRAVVHFVNIDERRLLPMHSEGYAGAFRELVERYRAPVYGYLVRCGVAPAMRDDLFQDIFMRIHTAAAS